MKSCNRVLSILFLCAYPALLFAQDTQYFEVSVSFNPAYTEAVTVELTCDGGVPLEQSFQLFDGQLVTFTVDSFLPSYTCVIEQSPVQAYDTSYEANGKASTDACEFSGEQLVINNTCVISNEVSAYSTTEFEVNMDFSDENPMDVEVEVSCPGATSVKAVDGNMASESEPAAFMVTWPTSMPVNCSAAQVSAVAGYNRSAVDCLDVPMQMNPEPQCTLKNYQRAVPVVVGASFLDGNPAQARVELSCEKGMAMVHQDMASHAGEAVFRVLQFPHSGTSCTAHLTPPEGYHVAESSCSGLSVTPGAKIACAFTSAPVTPAIPDLMAMTGSWYSPDSSGEGFMLHSVHETLAVGYFYGFDREGDPLWLIGVSEGPFDWGVPIVFEAQYTGGGSFTDFDPDQVVRAEWGQFSFMQWDCDRATMEMAGEHGAKKIHVIRLAQTSGTKCSGANAPAQTDSVSGSWFEPSTTGQGLALHVIAADHGVVYFYGYDDLGGNLWLTGEWDDEWSFGDEMMVEMLRVSGGTFDLIDPEQVVRETWGTLQLRFDDCDSAWARLEGIDGVQELDLVLLAGSLGLECNLSVD